MRQFADTRQIFTALAVSLKDVRASIKALAPIGKGKWQRFRKIGHRNCAMSIGSPGCESLANRKNENPVTKPWLPAKPLL
jgi:hypothetical protein